MHPPIGVICDCAFCNEDHSDMEDLLNRRGDYVDGLVGMLNKEGWTVNKVFTYEVKYNEFWCAGHRKPHGVPLTPELFIDAVEDVVDKSYVCIECQDCDAIVEKELEVPPWPLD